MTFFRLHLTTAFLLVFLTPGCYTATYQYACTPGTAAYETRAFATDFTPEKGDANYYAWFRLEVENTAAKTLVIDWNRTRYLLDGKNLGGFVWEGLDPETLARTGGEAVAPGQRISKRISPRAQVPLADRSKNPAGVASSGLNTRMLPPGENGIVLAVVVDGQLVRRKMAVTITETKLE